MMFLAAAAEAGIFAAAEAGIFAAARGEER